MEVDRIRTALANTTARLKEVKSEIENYPEMPNSETSEEIAVNEYMTLLQSISLLPPPPPQPFPWMNDDEPTTPRPPAPDPFTFWQLVKAFIGDEVVLEALFRVLPNVIGLSSTHLEELTDLIGKMSNVQLRHRCWETLLHRALNADRPVKSELIMYLCFSLKRVSLDTTELAARRGMTSDWPDNVRVEVCYMIEQSFPGSQPEFHAEVIRKMIENVQKNVVYDMRTIWHFYDLLNPPTRETLRLPSYVLRNMGAMGTGLGSGNVAEVLIRMHQQLPLSGWDTVWIRGSERLDVPAWKTPGLLRVFTIRRIVSDRFLVDGIKHIKTHMDDMSLENLEELVSYLVAAGDTSPGFLVTQHVIDMAEKYTPTSSDEGQILEQKVRVLVQALFLASGAQLSDVVNPKSILLATRFRSLLEQRDRDMVAVIFQVLMPRTPVSFPSMPPLEMTADTVRVSKALSVMGYTAESPLIVDGIRCDFGFRDEKVAILLEPLPVYSISRKRYVVSGMTEIRAKTLALRKNFKVIEIIPEMCQEEASILSHLRDPLRGVPVNTVVRYAPGIDLRLKMHQRIGQLDIETRKPVEIAKFLILILKSEIDVNRINFPLGVSSKTSGAYVLPEFIATYVMRVRVPVSIDGYHITANNVIRLAELLTPSAAASIGFPPIRIVARAGDLHPRTTISKGDITIVVDCPDDWNITEKHRNTIFLG
jgi:hypothetical protein